MNKRIKTFFVLTIFTSTLFAQPSWIDNPNTDTLIGGVGLSNDTNPISKRRCATVAARANIAETIKVEISSYFKMVSKSDNNSYTKVTEQMIEQKASEVLVGSVIKDSYEDKDGTLYVWVVVNKSQIKPI
jgi:hypothetical protein